MTQTKPRVLLVEDSNIDAELVLLHLERSGVDVDVRRARGRHEFVRAIGDKSIDLVLSDYSLPDIDGLEVVQIAQQALPDAPIVFVSGIGGEEVATNALQRGARDYVLKRNLQRLGGAVTRALAEKEERTRRREAEERLVRSEASMRLAMEAADLGAWELAADDVLALDATCRRMAGIEPGASIRLDEFVALVPAAAEATALRDSLATALKGRNEPPISLEFTVRASNGARSRVALRGRRQNGDDRLLGVMLDLTPRRQLESRHRQTELLVNLAAEATGLGIWEIDTGVAPMRIWVNDGYGALVGLPRVPDLAFPDFVERVVHAEDRARYLAGIDKLTQGGADQLEIEHRIAAADEQALRWLAVKARRATGFDGQLRLVGTAHDVTDSRRRQAQLVESNVLLELEVAERTRALSAETAERNRVENTLLQMQRMEAVGQLTAGVAHDFNNLLAVVSTNVELLGKLLSQKPDGDNRAFQRLTAMKSAVKRGATLTKQLLAFSRRQRLEPSDVNFNDIVLGMRDILHSTLGGSVYLTTELAEGLWTARVDPTQMELIILNLAINARDAMEVGGALRICTSNIGSAEAAPRGAELTQGEYVRLSVIDNGSGMPPDVLDRVFEPFFTTKEVGKGSGLGMAQVYGFAKQSHGAVSIDTAVGRGTTVHVYMPRSRRVGAGSGDGEQAVATDPRMAARRAANVLLVDDDQLVREATGALLEANGFRVKQADNGAAALKLLRDGVAPDLMLVDFAMPQMNGVELVKRARDLLPPDVPVLYLTGYADRGALGALDERHVLEKPVEEQILMHRIHELLSALR